MTYDSCGYVLYRTILLQQCNDTLNSGYTLHINDTNQILVIAKEPTARRWIRMYTIQELYYYDWSAVSNIRFSGHWCTTDTSTSTAAIHDVVVIAAAASDDDDDEDEEEEEEDAVMIEKQNMNKSKDDDGEEKKKKIETMSMTTAIAIAMTIVMTIDNDDEDKEKNESACLPYSPTSRSCDVTTWRLCPGHQSMLLPCSLHRLSSAPIDTKVTHKQGE